MNPVRSNRILQSLTRPKTAGRVADPVQAGVQDDVEAEIKHVVFGSDYDTLRKGQAAPYVL